MGETSAKERSRRTSETNQQGGVVGRLNPAPPDGGWGWVVVVASLMGNIIVDGINYSFGVFMLEFTAYFNETKSKTSLVGSMQCGIYLLTGPIVGVFVNKFGCRVVTVAGSLVSTLAFLLSRFSPTIEVLILTYGVMGGIGFGMIYLPSNISAGYYFERRRALAMGIATCGSGIGTLIFAPLSQFLLHEFDWKNTMFIVAGIVLQAAVCGMLMRPLEAPKRKAKRPETKNNVDRLNEQVYAKNGRTRGECVINMDATDLESFRKEKRQQDIELQVNDSVAGSSPSASVSTGLSSPDTHVARIRDLSMSDRAHHASSPVRPDKRTIVVIDGGGQSTTPTSKRPLTASSANIGINENSMNDIDEADANMSSRGSLKSICTRSSTQMNRTTNAPSQTSGNRPLDTGDRDISNNQYIVRSVRDTLAELFDFSLFSNIAFMLICVGNAFSTAGTLVPFVYLVDRAQLLGIEKSKAALLISIIGITNTLGRLAAGFLADLPRVDALVVNNVSLVLGGIACVLVPFCDTYATLILFSIVFGLCMGAIYDLTKSYDGAFYVGGGIILIGAMLHCALHLPCIKFGKRVADMEVSVKSKIGQH